MKPETYPNKGATRNDSGQQYKDTVKQKSDYTEADIANIQKEKAEIKFKQQIIESFENRKNEYKKKRSFLEVF